MRKPALKQFAKIVWVNFTGIAEQISVIPALPQYKISNQVLCGSGLKRPKAGFLMKLTTYLLGF